jgi:hypothetical protein
VESETQMTQIFKTFYPLITRIFADFFKTFLTADAAD